jgi:hypothetical protein
VICDFCALGCQTFAQQFVPAFFIAALPTALDFNIRLCACVLATFACRRIACATSAGTPSPETNDSLVFVITRNGDHAR